MECCPAGRGRLKIEVSGGEEANGQMGKWGIFLARDLLKEAGLLLRAGLCLERDAMPRPATLPASPSSQPP